jgi:predicted polyphosphate/ATP-dependent NAD kinase
MASVGIIANPASGRDIRRLVAHGSVFSNNEKVNIVRRILLGLDSLGLERVWIMPDTFRIGQRARDGLNLRLRVEEAPITMSDSAEDSTAAAAYMAEQGAGCIIALGGDGTSRAVAKGCGLVPLLPVSTGTNNVFPSMMEGTVAGLAAGLVAGGVAPADEVTRPAKRLEVVIAGQVADVALVDVAVSSDLFIGSRAIWDPARLRELVLARAGMHYIGLSSIGGALYPDGLAEDEGLYVRLGKGSIAVLAPIAPGIIHRIGVVEHRTFRQGESVATELENCTIALDGEREIEIGRRQQVEVRLTDRGPRVVNVALALALGARKGLFVIDKPGDA